MFPEGGGEGVAPRVLPLPGTDTQPGMLCSSPWTSVFPFLNPGGQDYLRMEAWNVSTVTSSQTQSRHS